MITVLCEGGCGRRVQVRTDGTGDSGWCFACWTGQSSVPALPVHHQLSEAAVALREIIDANGDPSDEIETVRHLINVISCEHELAKTQDVH